MGCKNLDEKTGMKVRVVGEKQEPGQGLQDSEKWFKPQSSLRSKLLQTPTSLDLGKFIFTEGRAIFIGKLHPQYFF